jgi:predicted O-methyltransferase YrrM
MHLPWRDVAPGAGPAISTSVTDAEAAMLGRLAAGRQVLEVGSASGYSAVVMALAGADHIVAVDPHTWIPGSYEAMLANLAAYQVTDRVEIIREYSQSALPQLAGEDARFGLVFVDGDHSADAARHDLRWALKLLKPGGVLAVHDYLEDCCCPGVREAADGMFGEGGEVTGTLLVVTP